MKAVILAGGLGTRISEETHLKPKPMIEIGGKPILWHIMKIYSAHGVNDFVICCGYKGYVIKEYFANYFLHMSDVTFDMANNQMEVHRAATPSPGASRWSTPAKTRMTGGRLKRVARLRRGRRRLLLHLRRRRRRRRHRRARSRSTGSTASWATVTAVQPARPLRRPRAGRATR